MKLCKKCNIEKPESEFYANAMGKRQVHSTCKKCVSKYGRNRYKTKTEQCRRITKKWRDANKGRIKETRDNNRRKLREEVYAFYGNKCACCGETEPLFFTIDHINNDGAEHRRKMGRKDWGGFHIDQWLKKNNFPPGFQLLCYNCNMGRARNGDICPHTEGRSDR